MKDKMIVKGRVKSGGQGETPIPNKVAKPGALDMKGTRVKTGPGLPRKGDAPMTPASRMGLNMSGTRVTSKEVGKR